jgi:c-di-GMP-binding flagellar brake protein YcgR
MNTVVDPLARETYDAHQANEDDQRFRVTAATEILSEMRAAMAQRALLTLRFGNRGECALSTLLEVDAAGNTLTLDACQSPLDQQKVLAAHALTLETAVHRIRIRFTSGRPAPSIHRGRPAMQIALPQVIVRVQRREAYRIETPVNEIVNCRFRHPVLENREVMLRVADLSVSGMGLTADAGLWPAEPGTVIKDCRIDLPENGVINCDSLVVRVHENPRTGKQRLRIGCQFLQLPNGAGTLLQRYILALERARLARSRGIKGG